ncbi:MAG: hypothetical protein WD669_07285 [Pirellulales bacterium]
MKVIVEPVLIDAGPLVALLNENDSAHDLCRDQADHIAGRVFTNWAVVTESAWLLRRESGGLQKLLRATDDEGISCLHVQPAAMPWLAAVADQYRNLEPQLADLTLLFLADRLRIRHIFTLDRRDFSV